MCYTFWSLISNVKNFTLHTFEWIKKFVNLYCILSEFHTLYIFPFLMQNLSDLDITLHELEYDGNALAATQLLKELNIEKQSKLTLRGKFDEPH